MKIYTRSGDSGQTGLFGGDRVSKADGRVRAYGAVDELNASIGWAITLNHELKPTLSTLQEDLFVIGADLSTPLDSRSGASSHVDRLTDESARRLEDLIDLFDAALPPLRNFVLPGGDPSAAALHLCRTICRRAEREVVALSEEAPVTPAVIVYLNRLSDLLFVLARWANANAGVEEPTWSGRDG